MTNRLTREFSVLLGEAFTLVTLIQLILKSRFDSGFLITIATAALILAPSGFQRLFHCRMSTPLYVYGIVYAICPMIGNVYNLYSIIPFWDKLLHISGGVMFAIVGLFLFKALVGTDKKRIFVTALFSLLFSMAISMVWEFYEFTTDSIFGTDTQADTVLSSISSWEIGSAGKIGTVENIESVVMNGKEMNWGGYLDIGLIDTMTDMILETSGAVAVVAVYLIDRDRHPPIVFNERRKHE